MPQPVKNDSIVLAQAYLNLTLTKEYFEGLSEERISRILPFEKTELASITDSVFIQDNAALYNFSYSILYYNQAKFQFRTKKNISRPTLIEWNNSLEKAIGYFNVSKEKSSWGRGNPFFELIKFEEESYTTLHKEIYELKSLFTPYFNENIYPDYKQILVKAKNSDRFEIDSLGYLAGIYDIESNTDILDKKYSTYNYDFGPNTLPVISEYNHSERDYDYNPYTAPIGTAYLLDEKLDLISRYVQLKSLASATNTDSLTWFESYRLYNDYYKFKDASSDKLFVNQITQAEDPFLRTELNSDELGVLYEGLRKKFPYEPYATAQAFINLSLIQSHFDKLDNSYITSVLAANETELAGVNDTSFIAQNKALYHFAYSLVYENTTRLLYRSRKNIDRKNLLAWKEALEKGIEFYNISQNEKRKGQGDIRFHDLIKFNGNDLMIQQDKLYALKKEFTPYFNEDIYPDFQRIFYKAKNSGLVDFDGLRAFAGMYNIKLDLSVLENREYEEVQGGGYSVSQDYDMLPKLDLTSKYLQFKFLASDQFKVPSGEFDVDQLYSSYNDFLNKLDDEKDAFILRELNSDAIDELFGELQSKFPYAFMRSGTSATGASATETYPELLLEQLAEEPYLFFPELAPLASASFVKRNFKPELNTLGKVDEFLRREFVTAGYKDQLHYYYASDGFAITTSLEKFSTDGSAVPADQRFVESLRGEKKLSYFEIFKSVFFDLEYEYRMFAFIVASNAITMSKNGMTPGFAEEIIANSYDALPAELTTKELTNKTLSVFTYHFHLNLSSGTVELDLSGKLSTQDYLKNAGLLNIIR